MLNINKRRLKIAKKHQFPAAFLKKIKFCQKAKVLPDCHSLHKIRDIFTYQKIEFWLFSKQIGYFILRK